MKNFSFFFNFFFLFVFFFFQFFFQFLFKFFKFFEKFSNIFEKLCNFYELWENLIKNTPVKTIKMINFVKKTFDFDFFFWKIFRLAAGPLLGKLLKRRAVSDGRLRRGLRARFFFDFSIDLKSDLRGKVVHTLRIWLITPPGCSLYSW